MRAAKGSKRIRADVTKSGHGALSRRQNIKYRPYVFTEHGTVASKHGPCKRRVEA